MPNNTSKSVNHNVSNVEFFTKIAGFAYRNNNYRPLPFVNPTYPSSSMAVEADNSVVLCFAGGNWSDNKAYITLEYIKTTD